MEYDQKRLMFMIRIEQNWVNSDLYMRIYLIKKQQQRRRNIIMLFIEAVIQSTKVIYIIYS